MIIELPICNTNFGQWYVAHAAFLEETGILIIKSVQLPLLLYLKVKYSLIKQLKYFVAGKNGLITLLEYSASKHALVGFFNTFQKQQSFVNSGVSTTVIIMGAVGKYK